MGVGGCLLSYMYCVCCGLQEYCRAALELQASKAQELFQFVLGAAHLWDVHLSDLEGEEHKMAVSQTGGGA